MCLRRYISTNTLTQINAAAMVEMGLFKTVKVSKH